MELSGLDGDPPVVGAAPEPLSVGDVGSNSNWHLYWGGVQEVAKRRPSVKPGQTRSVAAYGPLGWA